MVGAFVLDCCLLAEHCVVILSIRPSVRLIMPFARFTFPHPPAFTSCKFLCCQCVICRICTYLHGLYCFSYFNLLVFLIRVGSFISVCCIFFIFSILLFLIDIYVSKYSWVCSLIPLPNLFLLYQYCVNISFWLTPSGLLFSFSTSPLFFFLPHYLNNSKLHWGICNKVSLLLTSS